MLYRSAEPTVGQGPVNSFRLLPSRSQPIVGRFLWERIERARRATKSEPDLLRLAEASIMRRFLLARIGKAVAPPACEQLAHVDHVAAANA
jgi:hypothetical protein